MTGMLLASDGDFERKAGIYTGHLVYQKGLIEAPYQVNFEVEDFIQGYREAHEGKVPPISMEEFYDYITKAEKLNFERISSANLQEAEDILSQLKVPPIVKDKLFVEVLETGEGTKILQDGMGRFKMKANFLNVEPFYEGVSEQKLFSAIEGFSLGVEGMKEGEKRRLFIHPDLGYGIQRCNHPNKLLIVEVQLEKVIE